MMVIANHGTALQAIAVKMADGCMGWLDMVYAATKGSIMMARNAGALALPAIQDTKNVSVMTSTKNIKTANAALAGDMIIPVNQVNIARTANANQNAEIMYVSHGKAMTAAQQTVSQKKAIKIIALL